MKLGSELAFLFICILAAIKHNYNEVVVLIGLTRDGISKFQFEASLEVSLYFLIDIQ